MQRNRPEDVGLPPIASAMPVVGVGGWAVIAEVLRNPTVWLLGAVYFLLKPTRYAILFWGPKYLHDRLGTDVTDSSLLSALFELGGPLGIIALGLVSDRLMATRRFPVMIVSLALLAPILFFFDSLVGAGPWGTGFALFAMGFLLFGPDAIASSVAAIDFGKQRGAGTAAGMVNGLGSLGAIVGGSLPGIVSDRLGWNGVFIGLGVASLLAAAIMVPSWNRVPVER
jgi:sugar phosphate permease